MSLTPAQKARTRAELQANVDLAGIVAADACTDLGFAEDRYSATLTISRASRPEDVWLLRDYALNRIAASGGIPIPFTVLTDDAKIAAAQWFPLRELPTPRMPSGVSPQ